MGFYSEQSFTDLADRLERGCEWIRGIGVGHSATRLARYRALLSDLANLQGQGRPEDLLESHSFESFLNALHEATEIVDIAEGLRSDSRNAPALVSRFLQGLRGHELYILDNDDSSGRDFTFELQIAAAFERHGLTVNFDAMADVETRVATHPFFVECKRLRSKNKVEVRIKQAIRQLEKRYDSSPDPQQARGLVALSIGKLQNPEFDVLAADTEQALDATAARIVRAFVMEHARLWRQEPSPRTLGVLVCFDLMGIKNLPHKTPVSIRQRGLVSLVEKGTGDHALFLRIAELFRRVDHGP